MIYLFHGNSKKVFEKSTKLVESLLVKKPDAEVFKISSENWSQFNLNELAGGQSLFSKKYIVQISRILEYKEFSEILLDKIEQLKSSENIFILSEPDISAKDLKKIEKFCEKIQDFSVSGGSEKSYGAFNNFALADAFGERNSKKLWTLYLQAMKNSVAEEIHGLLWWQLKSMIVASQTNSAEESGLKPFVYSKSKKFARNFTAEELQKLSDQMIEIYHESHRGGADLEMRLEKFVLGGLGD